MQQIINFNISIEKGFKEIQARVKSIILSYLFETPFSQEETEKRIHRWINGITFIPAGKGDAGEIQSFSEEPMFIFDYEAVFPMLFSDIAKSCPDSEFYGHAEYYNDDFGIMTFHDKKYVGGILSDGKKETKKNSNIYHNNVIFNMPKGDINMSFSYERIDEVADCLNEETMFGNGIVPENETQEIVIGDLKVSVNVRIRNKALAILSEIKNSFSGGDLDYPLYDPFYTLSTFGPGSVMVVGYSEWKLMTKELSNAQIAHRAKIFFTAIEKMKDKDALKTIVEFAPKKKNGKLYAKRVTPIASLFCMDKEAQIYMLRAKADSEDVLTIEIVQSVCPDMDRLNTDVISETDFFSRNNN